MKVISCMKLTFSQYIFYAIVSFHSAFSRPVVLQRFSTFIVSFFHETARAKCQRINSFSVWLHPLKLTIIDDGASSKAGTFTITDWFSVKFKLYEQCLLKPTLWCKIKLPGIWRTSVRIERTWFVNLNTLLGTPSCSCHQGNSSYSFHKENLDFGGFELFVKQQTLFIIQKVMQMR